MSIPAPVRVIGRISAISAISVPGVHFFSKLNASLGEEPYNDYDDPSLMPANPTLTPFQALGGEEGVRALVNRFYDLVESAPEAANLRRIHGPSLESAREKLTLYLTGWTGGPPVYVQRYGHPMLRARHMPFPIGNQERDEWLWCMERALEQQDMPGDVRQFLMTRLRPLADHMRNRLDNAVE